MAISINWGTKVITVPQSDLTPLGGSLYELNVDTFRMSLKDLEDDVEGMTFPDTHQHNTEVELGGVTYARFVEIINGYTITFEDGQYAVNLVGANNNILDVANVNSVSLRSSNSAGLVTVDSGAGDWTETEKSMIRHRLGVDGALSAPTVDPSLIDSIETLIQEIAGLSQKNYYLDNAIYDTYQGQKLLTSGRIRIYSNSGSVGTDNDVLLTLNIVGTWSNDELQTYKVVAA